MYSMPVWMFVQRASAETTYCYHAKPTHTSCTHWAVHRYLNTLVCCELKTRPYLHFGQACWPTVTTSAEVVASLFGRCSAFDVTGLLAIIDFLFFFPLVLSCLPTHLFSIPFINCCVFNPLFPLMSLSEIVVHLSCLLLVRDGSSYQLCFDYCHGFGAMFLSY